jgi:PGF-CTERM protein
MLLVALPGGIAAEQNVQVAVNAPAQVEGTFDAAIDVDRIMDFNSGQFDLSFDSRVVNVTDVKDGEINGEAVPIFMWSFVDAETVRVLVSMPMGKGVSGSGCLAEVEFEVKGRNGDKSNLDISNGLLVDTEAKEIEAEWDGADVRISGEEKEPAPTPVEEAPPTEKTTPTPTAPPSPEEKPTSTPKPSVPGFEAVFAIIGMLSIAYILQRRRR